MKGQAAWGPNGRWRESESGDKGTVEKRGLLAHLSVCVVCVISASIGTVSRATRSASMEPGLTEGGWCDSSTFRNSCWSQEVW